MQPRTLKKLIWIGCGAAVLGVSIWLAVVMYGKPPQPDMELVHLEADDSLYANPIGGNSELFVRAYIKDRRKAALEFDRAVRVAARVNGTWMNMPDGECANLTYLDHLCVRFNLPPNADAVRFNLSFVPRSRRPFGIRAPQATRYRTDGVTKWLQSQISAHAPPSVYAFLWPPNGKLPRIPHRMEIDLRKTKIWDYSKGATNLTLTYPAAR